MHKSNWKQCMYVCLSACLSGLSGLVWSGLVCLSVHACMYVCMHVCLYMYIYKYIYIYILDVCTPRIYPYINILHIY